MEVLHGVNYYVSTIQSRFLVAQLSRFKTCIRHRREREAVYLP